MQNWEGLTPDQYDALREIVGWDHDVPAGRRFHVASFGDGVLRMTDVWDSEELRAHAQRHDRLWSTPADVSHELQRAARRAFARRSPRRAGRLPTGADHPRSRTGRGHTSPAAAGPAAGP